MPAHFTHITFTVADFDRSIEFYRSVCEMCVVRDRRKEGGTTVWLGPATKHGHLPSYVFVLVEGKVTLTDRLDHLAFQCDSRREVDDKAALAAKLGSLVTGPVDMGSSVGYLAMLRDPDGHLVEFTHGQPIAGVL